METMGRKSFWGFRPICFLGTEVMPSDSGGANKGQLVQKAGLKEEVEER